MILESLIIPLVGDAKELIKALNAAEKESESSSKNIRDKFKSVGDGMMKVGGAMTLGVTTPIVAGMMDSVNAASDLSETVSKVGVVFGEQAPSILAFGDNAAQALGMSKEAALGAAGTYGNLFVSMGMTNDKSAEMSTGLITLAADLASFNNMDSSEVLAKLQSGLTSSTEPLQALGVNINQAAIEAQAMKMGLMEVGGELTASAKAQATYALILEQTKTAQGDFARTSDGLANSTRIAQAEFENVKAELGESLLPVMTDLMKHISKVVEWFGKLDPQTKNTIVVIAGVAAAIGPVITVVGGLISGVTTIVGLFSAGGAIATAATFVSTVAFPAIVAAITAIGWPIIAIVALVAGLIYVFVNFGDEIWAFVQKAWSDLNGLSNNIKLFFIQALVDGFLWVQSTISGAIDWIMNLGSSLMSLVIPDWLQMHSPPPLATALSMVGDEMKALSRATLPEFESKLNMSGVISNNARNVATSGNKTADITRLVEQLIEKQMDADRFAYVIGNEVGKRMLV